MNIEFKSTLECIHEISLFRIPCSESIKLPSRGMLMAEVTIDVCTLVVPLEPDGQKSHWFKVPYLDAKKNQWTKQEVLIHLTLVDNWPSPHLPIDLKHALENEQLMNFWDHLTPKAQWDWIRWIRSTKNQSTHDKRIHVTVDKMKRGEKRPCCFDRTRCTVEEVSKSGILLSSMVNK